MDRGYTLTSESEATGAAAGTYTWYEDGVAVDNSNTASLTIAAGTKAAGVYEYVRMAGSEECEVSSNTFTVTVNPVPAIHTASQTVNQGTPISTILYVASAGATISMTGTLPPGVTSAVNGSSYTISGTPSGTGTFGYELISTMAGCTSTATAGTITVTCGGGMTKPLGAVSDKMWCFGIQTWSDRILVTPSNCASTATFSSASPPPAQYKISDSRHYYNWTCVNAANTTLCPWPWRVPVESDFRTLIDNFGTVLYSAWGYGGWASGSTIESATSASCYSSATQAFRIYYNSGGANLLDDQLTYGFQVRCVR
jgi:hypothetical protein